MATRATPLSAAHVDAFNAIPVEFYGEKGKLKAINDAWKLYLNHHDSRGPWNEAWGQRRSDLFFDLLYLISKYLGYEFSKAQLEREIYAPLAHGDQDAEQTTIRKGLAKIFNGDAAFPMSVQEFPATADGKTLENQAEIQKLLIEVLNGQRPLSVRRSEEE